MFLVLIALTAAADPDALWSEAARAERSGQLSAMSSACAQLIEHHPDHRRASSCRHHLARIDDRRSADGSLHHAEELERLRRIPADEARSGVRALYARRDLPPALLTELGLWLAFDALEHHHDALPYTTALFEAPPSDPSLSSRILEVHRAALTAAGRADEAAALRPPKRFAPPSTTRADRVLLEQRRRQRATISAWIGGLGILLLLPGIAGWFRAPRPAPWALIPLAIACGGGLIVAEAWEEGAGAALLPLGIAAACIHLLALGLGRLLHSARPRLKPLRFGVAVIGGITTLALAYLAIAWTGTLDWIGL